MLAELREVWLCHVDLILAAFVLYQVVSFFHLMHVKLSPLFHSFNIKRFVFH